jgi:hypothetical protein
LVGAYHGNASSPIGLRQVTIWDVGNRWDNPAYGMYIQQQNNTWTKSVIEYPPLKNYMNLSLEEKPVGKGIFFDNYRSHYAEPELDK